MRFFLSSLLTLMKMYPKFEHDSSTYTLYLCLDNNALSASSKGHVEKSACCAQMTFVRRSSCTKSKKICIPLWQCLVMRQKVRLYVHRYDNINLKQKKKNENIQCFNSQLIKDNMNNHLWLRCEKRRSEIFLKIIWRYPFCLI